MRVIVFVHIVAEFDVIYVVFRGVSDQTFLFGQFFLLVVVLRNVH